MVSTVRKYNAFESIVLFPVFAAVLVFIFLLINNIYKLSTGNYRVELESLVRIDSIATGGKAFVDDGRSAGTGHRLVYIINNSQRFVIGSYQFSSITDRGKLIELLGSKGELFTIFTDKKGTALYHAGKPSGDIDIYQLIIARHNYINIYQRNETARSGITWQSLVFSLFIVFPAIYARTYWRRYQQAKKQAKIINL